MTTMTRATRARALAAAALCALLACGPLAALGGGPRLAQAARLPVQPALLRLAATRPDTRVRVIVQAQGSTAPVRAALARLGGRVTDNLSLIHAVVATLPARAVPQLAQARGVRYVSPDGAVVKSSYTCCSATTLTESYAQSIHASDVWGTDKGTGVGVAVVDSGVHLGTDFTTALSTTRVMAQVKFNSATNSMADAYGHGTHVAGIIGGNGATSSGGYVGVAPDVNLINVKVSDDTGNAAVSDVVNGLQWVYNNAVTDNIRVVNLSLNSTVADSYQVDPLDAAVETLWNAGIVVVVSAGNNGTSNAGVVYAPANDPFVLTVGAVNDQGTASTSDDTLASFSSYGTLPVSTTAGLTTNLSKPDLVAPGVNIISVLASNGATLAKAHAANVVNSSYFRMSGTSMAAPMVSGAAALLLQANPLLTPNQVKYRLMSTATPLSSTASTGAGEVNVAAAIASTSTASANANLAAAASLQGGNPAALWGSASWGSASWGSASWGSASWGSASWGSASWGSASWGSASWGSDYWGP